MWQVGRRTLPSPVPDALTRQCIQHQRRLGGCAQPLHTVLLAIVVEHSLQGLRLGQRSRVAFQQQRQRPDRRGASAERQQPPPRPLSHLEPAICGQHLALGGHGGRFERLWAVKHAYWSTVSAVRVQQSAQCSSKRAGGACWSRRRVSGGQGALRHEPPTPPPLVRSQARLTPPNRSIAVADGCCARGMLCLLPTDTVPAGLQCRCSTQLPAQPRITNLTGLL